jgi:hypothetical protein
MPAWLFQLIKLAISIGSPYLLAAISKWVGNLPAEVQQIITDLINSIKDPTIPNRVAKAQAKRQLKAHCEGVACQTEIKSDK